MTDSQLDFAALDPVNHLWPAFVERLGSEKAQRAVRQALDLQEDMYLSQASEARLAGDDGRRITHEDAWR